MKKKFTEEEIAQILGALADEVRSSLDYDFRVARGQMDLAEKELVKTLNGEQLKLYNEYCNKRKEFYDTANEIYTRKF